MIVVRDMYDPTLRPLADVGGEPTVVLQSCAQPRTGAQSGQPKPTFGGGDREPGEDSMSAEERLQAAGFRKRGGAWRR